jgi:hypothetical protein
MLLRFHHSLLVLVLATPARADEPVPDQVPTALVVHVPPLTARPAQPIELEAMLDAPYAATLAARWRLQGDRGWHEVVFERSSAGGWFASLPGHQGGVEYYLVSRPAMGGVDTTHFGSADAPHFVRVEPELADRLERLELDRLGHRRNQVSVAIAGHDFGNRYDLPDRFVRTELGYTHRLLRGLYHVAFGFGSISGETPLVSAPDGAVDGKGLRYGFGEVRIRAHPSVYLDARASLGASHAGFDQGLRGAITFGKPWRSSVSVGGERLGDVGASAWVRLQWDTAPPFLMGASIVRTDLPGAVIDAAGLVLVYDVAYTLAQRLSVKAQLSYGSRDGGANFGGGVGTALDF